MRRYLPQQQEYIDNLFFISTAYGYGFLDEYYPGCWCNYDPDGRTDYIDIKFDDEIEPQTQEEYAAYMITLSMIRNILKTGKNDNVIDIKISESLSGKLLASGNTAEGVSWTSEGVKCEIKRLDAVKLSPLD